MNCLSVTKGNIIESNEEGKIEQKRNKIAFESPLTENEKQQQTLSNEIASIHYFSVGSGIFFAILSTSVITLVPLHNILKEPQYIYEVIIGPSIAFYPFCIATLILQCAYWTNITYSKSWPAFFCLYSLGAIIYSFLCLAYYFIWTYYLAFFAPMPFTGYFSGTITFFALYIALWFG